MVQLLLLCILFGLAVSAVLIVLIRSSVNSTLERIAPLVENRFALLSAPAENPRFSFDGETAETVHDFAMWEGESGNDRVSLNRICKNTHGEYFHVIISSEDDSTYINHLTAERAALALKGTGVESPPPVEEPLSNFAKAIQQERVETYRPSFPIVIPGESNAGRQNVGAAGSKEDKNTPSLLRPITRLPLDSPWFATTTGFAVMAIFWIGLAVYIGRVDMINLVELMYVLLKGMLVLLVVAGLFRWWQGERYNCRHWFIRMTTFLTHTWYGIALSAGAYDIVVWAFTRK